MSIQTVKANGYRDGKPVTDKEYKLLNGTYFDGRTPDKVCEILAQYPQSKKRIKIYLGDIETGRDWHEESDKYCTIGRSTGEIKIPLCIHSTRSQGGGGLLDHCIVKLTDIETGQILYQHEKYTPPVIEILPADLPEYNFMLKINGETYSRHKTELQAKRLKNKLS